MCPSDRPLAILVKEMKEELVLFVLMGQIGCRIQTQESGFDPISVFFHSKKQVGYKAIFALNRMDLHKLNCSK